MSWLTMVFGLERLLNARVILPTAEFFPDPYAGTEEDVHRLFERICGFMGVDPGRVDLGFLDDEDPGTTGIAGLYFPGDRERIFIKDSQKKDPMALVATLSHELAHVLLLGDGRITDEAADHEQVTDLLTVYLGLGVFGSNSVMREAHETTGHWHRWSISKQGYLFEKDYGYALAVFAYLRREIQPAWISYLRSNVRFICKAGLQYLNKTKDSQFYVDVDEETKGHRIARLRLALQSPSIGTRVSALWDLRIDGPLGVEALPELIQSIQDNDDFVRKEAAVTLGLLGPAAESAVPPLLEATLLESESSTRVAMLSAITRIARKGENVVPKVTVLLKDPNPIIRAGAAKALGAFGALAIFAMEEVIPLINDADEEVHENAIQVVSAIGSGAESAIPSLIHVIKTGDGPQRAHAVNALGKIGIASETVLKVLHKAAVQDEDPGLRYSAIEALGNLGPPAKSVTASLEGLLASEDADTSVQAAVALAKIDGRFDQALQTFQDHLPKALLAFTSQLATLSESEKNVYKQIVDALQNLSLVLVPTLLERLRRSDQEGEAFALWALGIIGPAATSAKEDLQGRLASINVQSRFLAAWGLCRVAVPADAAVSILIEFLELDDRESHTAMTISEKPEAEVFQVSAAHALATIGISTPTILLDQFLKSGTYSEKMARLVGRLAQDSEKVAELLETAKLQVEPDVRRRVSKALEFQKEARDAVRTKLLRTMSVPPLLETLPSERQYDLYSGFLIW